MAKAPSEKHLEDWIVAHPDLVREEISPPIEEWDGYVEFINKVISRQAKLPSGICDLIVLNEVYGPLSLCVVEIKKGIIDSYAVTQCLRYIRDLHEIFRSIAFRFDHDNGQALFEKYPTYQGMAMRSLHNAWPEITGMVIGSGIESDNLMIACEASYIHVINYDYWVDTNEYVFWQNTTNSKLTYPQRQGIYEDYSRGAVGEAMREVMVQRHKEYTHLNGDGSQ